MKIYTAEIVYGEDSLWVKLGKNYVLQSDILMRINTDRGTYKVRFKRNFKCDGLSVPKIFQWFLPSWDKQNLLYNLAGAFHDWLYATGGNKGEFTREECDDCFRCLLRESGVTRFKAGAADLAVGLFAGCKHHWKNDSNNIADKLELKLYDT